MILAMRLTIIQTAEARRKVTRGVGNSSGDENGSDSIKYWEIIADRLHAAGWSYGIAEHLTKRGLLFCVDAHRGGKRFVALLSWRAELNGSLRGLVNFLWCDQYRHSRFNGCGGVG